MERVDAETKGLVLDIERFARRDGPGIRTVVFLKGCPLRCLWCSTPDSQSELPEMEFFEDRCIGCAKCVAACPNQAVHRSDDGKIHNDRARCMSCGRCVSECTVGARQIAGREMTIGEVLEEVEKDRVFYSKSGGGVTLSGGEATMQAAFSEGILEACLASGIHTAVETCGYTRWGTLKKLVRRVDLVYLDIKHMSSAEHKEMTRRGNRLVLDNAARIVGEHPSVELVIRIPVIPGYNDSDDNLLATASFVHGLRKECAVELLPYHRLGIHRYNALSRDYALSDVEPPSEDRMRCLEQLMRASGVKVLCDA